MQYNDHCAKIRNVPLHRKESIIFGFDQGSTSMEKKVNVKAAFIRYFYYLLDI